MSTAKETNSTHIRTAAVLYADDNQNISAKSIHKKIIEAALLENKNKPTTIFGIIELCQNHFNLTFDEREILNIVNEKKNQSDFIVEHNKENEKTKINLSPSRFNNLQEKEKSNNIEFFINQFIAEFNSFNKKIDVKETIYKYLYFLLNTNITSFSKLTKGDIKTEDINIDSSEFSIEQREVINQFLNWDNFNKNKSLFSIISYSIEYCLITNKKEGSDYYLRGIKDKFFYLDTNIIFRALGINGNNRQKQILTFIQKCVENGEKLSISKFTDVEFREALDYHIKQIKRVPTGRVNPKIFQDISKSSSVYEFFHKWRVGKSNSGYELFKAYILDLYQKFINEYSISVEYKMPYDESDEKIEAKIQQISQSIGSHKSSESTNGNVHNTNYSDANNLFLIEQKRGNNCRTITDTKFFFVSTDQSLRRWDFNRAISIPIVLLPSQWMGVLLKYVGRTSDDYKSFVSFLNLKQTQPIINPERLHTILAGISEITEDFEYQSTIIHRMIEIKFDGIMNGEAKDEEIIEKSKDFAKINLQTEIANLKESNSEHIEKIEALETELKNEVKQLSDNIKFKENSSNAIFDALVLEKLNNWKLKGKIFLFLGVLFLLFGVYECLPTWELNFPAKIMNWIDSLSDSRKALLNTANYAVIVGGMGTCFMIWWRRHYSESHINEFKGKIKL